MKQTLLIILTVLFVCSCSTLEQPAQTFPPNYTGPAIIKVTPWETTLVSGSTGHIYVSILDENRNPLPGLTVTATMDSGAKSVAYFDTLITNPVTNEKGQAVFVAVGTGFPDNGNIKFSCGPVSKSVYIWTQGNSPFEPPGPD
ncbi:MAG: Ig-like domain-containing protein [Candidatus Brocadiales bacterium]|nr:Ig-like domain-containing protein [Candidatus Bathyanammoxibius amoris]